MTDYEKLYKDEVERREWEDFRRRQDEQRTYEEREAVRREELEAARYERHHSASSWPQAFNKNIGRLESELSGELALATKLRDEESAYDNSDGIRFWREQIQINKAACDYLAEEMSFIQPVIDKLHDKIALLERRARQRVLRRIIETMPGNYGTVDCLVDGNPSDLLWW